MTFLIQDLLDYAQLRTGNFRKNLKQFNIREAIEEVMSIQREQARTKGIDLTVNYTNICEAVNVDQSIHFNQEIFSPEMKSDVNRLQQVILNL